MGKTKATNLLQLIAFGLVIYSVYAYGGSQRQLARG